MTDLVKRLRELLTVCDETGTADYQDILVTEAADRIEALDAENARLTEAVQVFRAMSETQQKGGRAVKGPSFYGEKMRLLPDGSLVVSSEIWNRIHALGEKP